MNELDRLLGGLNNYLLVRWLQLTGSDAALFSLQDQSIAVQVEFRDAFAEIANGRFGVLCKKKLFYKSGSQVKDLPLTHQFFHFNRGLREYRAKIGILKKCKQINDRLSESKRATISKYFGGIFKLQFIFPTGFRIKTQFIFLSQ